MKTRRFEWMDRFATGARVGALCAIAVLALAPTCASAFVSGSDGTSGAFNPTVDTQVQLPPSGIFNYTSVNVPSGVTVTFKRNTTNTPIVWLVSGDVTIVGTVDLNGQPGTPSGAAGSGNLGDDGLPGAGGPGGFDGGRGGAVNSNGGAGLGPGGGGFGFVGNSTNCGNTSWEGGGGGFGTAGGTLGCTIAGGTLIGVGGTPYGATLLLPLIGGSGGGGGSGASTFAGSGGGGGAGALLIAASGTVNVTGTVRANGGVGGATAGAGCGAGGSGGSGGGIRIVATTIAGNGTIQAIGASGGGGCTRSGRPGGDGRIRLEAEIMQRTSGTSPTFTFAAPGAVFVSGSPTLLITSVAGVTAPSTPTGNADIVLPSNTPNPVTVVFTTTGIPVGNTVTLTVTPAIGPTISVVSPALTGSTASATASVSVNLPSGPSTLAATTTFTVSTAMGESLSRFAKGERVDKITLVAKLGAPSTAILHTVSGKTYEIAATLLPAGS